jgi:hypothetical protein
MNLLSKIPSDIALFLLSGDQLKIKGLSKLAPDEKENAIAFIKANKKELIYELQINQCPARCKRTGKCYGYAFFNGKGGSPSECLAARCKYQDKLRAYWKRYLSFG